MNALTSDYVNHGRAIGACQCGVVMMPKAKIHSGAAKRFKKTAGGYKRKSAYKSHILTKMTTKRKRQLRGTSMIHKSDEVLIDRMLRAK